VDELPMESQPGDGGSPPDALSECMVLPQRVRFARHDASLPTPGLRSKAESRAGPRRDAGARSRDL